MTKRMALAGYATMLASVGASCAGAGGEEPDLQVPQSRRQIVVVFTVSNEVAPRVNVTVRLRSGETTWILGSVNPGLERTFEIELPATSADYRLTATSVALADQITSESFSLSARSAVRWRVADNALDVDRLPESQP